MKRVVDVAECVLSELNDVSAMKLQKLVSYSQVYHLVTVDESLFSEHIEAWVNGPVIPYLYEAHKGQAVFALRDMNFPHLPVALDAQERASVLRVLSRLGS